MAEEKRTPVEYRVKEKSFINDQMLEAGATVFYDGLPSGNLEPINDEGRRRAQEFKLSDKERAAKMVADNKAEPVADPSKFVEAMSREMAAQKAESDARFEQQNQTIVQLLQALTKAVPTVVHTDEPATAPRTDISKPAQRIEQTDDRDTAADVKTDGTTTGARAAKKQADEAKADERTTKG